MVIWCASPESCARGARRARPACPLAPPRPTGTAVAVAASVVIAAAAASSAFAAFERPRAGGAHPGEMYMGPRCSCARAEHSDAARDGSGRGCGGGSPDTAGTLAVHRSAPERRPRWQSERREGGSAWVGCWPERPRAVNAREREGAARGDGAGCDAAAAAAHRRAGARLVHAELDRAGHHHRVRGSSNVDRGR